MINGVIIQREDNRKYKGIEGDNWYLNELVPELDEYFNEIDERVWHDSDFVAVCNDMSVIETYIRLSDLNKIKFRMLLCETEKTNPKFQNVLWKTRFIGYDYANPGDYYSAVWNDVGRIERFRKFKLNSYGLFDTFNEITDFAHARQCYEKELIEKNKMDMTLEKGEFIIYKLYEIILE